MAAHKKISRFFRVVVAQKLSIALLTFFIIIILIPLLIIIMPLMVLIRKSISILARFLRPDLGKILSATSSVMSVDEIYTNPKLAATALSHLRGTLDMDAIKSKMVNEVIGVREVRGELKNVELKQYPYRWMGFVFWKWDEHFDISNHIKWYQNEKNPETKISLERIREIEQEFLFKPFPKKRSPWEAIIFPSVKSVTGDDETAILFRFHHSMGDGYSLLKLLCFEILDEIPKEFIPNPVFPKQAFFQRFAFSCKCLIAPYMLAKMLAESWDINEWKIPANKMSKNWIAKLSDEISVDVIKEVKDNFNSSVTSVIFSALTAALRNAMLKKNGRVPKYIHAGLAVPIKFHADKLRNVVVVVFLQLPVGEQDPVQRLKLMDRNLLRLLDSPVPYMMYGMTVLMGFMFPWMIRPLLRYTPPTAGGSTFPGPNTQLKFFGRGIIDTHFALGPLFGNMGLAFTTLTYQNRFKTRIMVNENILGKQTEVEQITKDIIEEFYVLKRCRKSVV